MISLNDVLLAASNIPVDDPIAEIWGRGLQSGYKIIEYTGTFPITINANGDALLDYRIYGASGGAGEPTDNLLDTENLERGMINNDGTIYTSVGRRNGRVSSYIDVTGTSSVVLTQDRLTEPLVDQYMQIGCWDENKNFIANSRAFAYVDKNRPNTPISLVKSLPSGTKYIRAGVFLNHADDDIDSVHAMLNAGSTALTYEPYGYKLPMTVRSENLIDASLSEQTIEIKPSTQYNVSRYDNSYNAKGLRFGIYDENDVLLWSDYLGTRRGENIKVYDNAKYFKITIPDICLNAASLVEGIRPPELTVKDPYPENYIPYQKITTPVYIGGNQLDAIGEYRDYVDFGIQKIARKIREYTFTGNETFNLFAQNAYGTCWVNLRLYTTVAYCPIHQTTLRSSHFTAINNSDANFWYGYPQLDDACNFEKEDGYDTVKIFFRSTENFSTAEECKAYFKEQYDNGTPVKIWFVMKYTVGQYESTDNGKEDPPIPLPEIPTVDGTTVIDYDGTPKPSQMYVKYKGKG